MATFGYTSIGTSEDSEGEIYGVTAGPYTPASNGTITQLSLYCKTSGGTDFKVAIYSDNSGTPKNLLAQSGAVSVGTSYSWVNFSISLAVTAGTYYWFVFECLDSVGTWQVKYDATGSNNWHYISGAYPNFVDPWQAGVWGFVNQALSIYATYTPSGGGISMPVVMAHRRQQRMS